jgi:hypothetical protein
MKTEVTVRTAQDFHDSKGAPTSRAVRRRLPRIEEHLRRRAAANRRGQVVGRKVFSRMPALPSGAIPIPLPESVFTPTSGTAPIRTTRAFFLGYRDVTLDTPRSDTHN